MEDFDLFTNEITFTRPCYKNILKNFVNNVPATPNGANYQCSRKLSAEECLAVNDDTGCAFHLSEAVSASLRTMAVFRDDQSRAAANKLHDVTSFIKPIQDIIDANPISKKEDNLFHFPLDNPADVANVLKSFQVDELPFHTRYLKFSKENNVHNFQKILKELPKEWTIVQITTPYNPNENIKPFNEYKTEIDSIFLSVFSNDYLNDSEYGPLTIHIPANVSKEGELPLFTELYLVLEEHYKAICSSHQLINDKIFIQNYWQKREDLDLRMKSVINKMDKDWVGGWGSLLTGKLIDEKLKGKIVQVVDSTITDCGLVKLSLKQKILLCKLIECCPQFTALQTKLCIRRILTENGNPKEVRKVLPKNCSKCTKHFKFLTELCMKCLSTCFKSIHNLTLVDGIRAFLQTVKLVKDSEEWGLKTAQRYPVILIVDEMLDSFPWENLSIIKQHPVSRMENIHFTYYLYKIHEKNIVDGYFVAKCDVGRYVINPEKNLDRTEKRMMSFVQYWCPQWRGHVAETPSPDQFLAHLSDADLFLYCGHGNGSQFVSGAADGIGIEGAVGARAVVVLAGCASVRLDRPPGRAPPLAAHYNLHIAGFPMVVGMLWEVTDLEVDKVVTTLLSLYVPSDSQVLWPSVGKKNWSQGILDTTGKQKRSYTPEHDFLRAMCKARGSTDYVMIGSCTVARGIPVRRH